MRRVLSRRSPGEGDARARAAGRAAALGAPAGPPSLPPGATRPGLVSTPGRPRAPTPTPSTAPPASRTRPGSRAGSRRGQLPRRTHTRVPPPRLCPARSPGWCSRRRWAASNAALRAIPAQPPPSPRRSPPAPPAEPSPRPLPAPAQPLGGIVRTPLARRRGGACSRLQRGILRAQWPCRLSRHKAGALPTPLPPRAPTGAPAIFFFSIEFTFSFPLYLEAGWAGLPRLCPASHPGCCMGFERSPSASGSRRARAGRAAGRAARGHSLRLALPSRRIARPPSR